MNVLYGGDQHAIADAARHYLAREWPSTRWRDAPAAGPAVAAADWAHLAELGWLGLGVPVADGGAGGSLLDQVALFRELGRFLVPGPLLATVLAVELAHGAADADRVAQLTEGRLRAGLAVPHTTLLHRSDGAWHGDVLLVDGDDADLLVLAAGPDLALLRAADAGDPTRLACLDPATRLARACLAGAPSEPLPGAVDVDGVLLRGRVLLAALLVGNAEATRDMSAAYTAVRQQFGRPIATFQAVAHRCADMAVRAEVALAQTMYAALTVAGARPSGPVQAAAALTLAERAAVLNGQDNIQNHGGIGMTAEHDAHLFLTRALVMGRVLGVRAALLRDVLAEQRLPLSFGD